MASDTSSHTASVATSAAAAAAAAQPGPDADWWVSDNKKDTFVEIPSIVNGRSQKTRWWTSYWFNQEPGWKGYYVWGDMGNPKLAKFDSIFDPGQSVVQQGDGVLLKVKRNGNDAPYVAELVLEGLVPHDSKSHPGFGHYAVTAVGQDLGNLDPNVVLGIFTYQYGPSTEVNTHREIDLLETIAGYQQTDDKNNAQFALQPASGDPVNGLVGGKRFTIPRGTQIVTTYLNWSGSSIIALRIYPGRPTMDEMINQTAKTLPDGFWSVTPSDKVPKHKNERMHINFYVPNGRTGKGLPKTDQQVSITQFQYKSPP